tara:strand:+ start:2815 stop:3210 length:396 start_codon:yes stop_codon:yes gene_type:complete
MNAHELSRKLVSSLISKFPYVYGNPKSFNYYQPAELLGGAAVYGKEERKDGVIIFFVHNLTTGEKVDLQTFSRAYIPEDFSVKDALISEEYFLEAHFFSGDVTDLAAKILNVFHESLNQDSNKTNKLKLVN